MVAVLEDTARTERVDTVDMDPGMKVAQAAVLTDMTNLSKHIHCSCVRLTFIVSAPKVG